MEYTAASFLQNCLIQELLHNYARRCRFAVTSFWVDARGSLVASDVTYDPDRGPDWKNKLAADLTEDEIMVKNYAFMEEGSSAEIVFGDRDARVFMGYVNPLDLRPIAYYSGQYKKWVLTDHTFNLPYFLPEVTPKTYISSN